jgi:hypothetical protein
MLTYNYKRPAGPIEDQLVALPRGELRSRPPAGRPFPTAPKSTRQGSSQLVALCDVPVPEQQLALSLTPGRPLGPYRPRLPRC